jgi:hypothetical protein
MSRSVAHGRQLPMKVDIQILAISDDPRSAAADFAAIPR